jgi:5-methylcytosine-specific restriction protein A
VPSRVPSFRPPAFGPALDRHRAYNRDGRDPTLLKLYSKAPWKKFRAAIRRERVLCERCNAAGRVEEGREVHHKVDPRERPDLICSRENVELLCKSCHSRETASKG